MSAISQSVNQSINQLINQNQSTNQSINRSVSQSVSQSLRQEGTQLLQWNWMQKKNSSSKKKGKHTIWTALGVTLRLCRISFSSAVKAYFRVCTWKVNISDFFVFVDVQYTVRVIYNSQYNDSPKVVPLPAHQRNDFTGNSTSTNRPTVDWLATQSYQLKTSEFLSVRDRLRPQWMDSVVELLQQPDHCEIIGARRIANVMVKKRKIRFFIFKVRLSLIFSLIILTTWFYLVL